jgi:hypothetical protein
MREVVLQEAIMRDIEAEDLHTKEDLSTGVQMTDPHLMVEEAVTELDLSEEVVMIGDHSLETERHQETKMATGKTFTKDLKDLGTTLETDSSEWTRCAINQSKSSHRRLVITLISKVESTEIQEIDQVAAIENSDL